MEHRFELEMETWKTWKTWKTKSLVISRCCFAEGQKNLQ